jgi:hypothetical protein
MNTNALKKFAQEARIKLLDQVGAKLEFVLNTDTPELREKGDQVRKLREELTKTTKEQLIDKVSYTWFNRLMALRFMDANDYQPIGLRVVTPKNGYTLPELLDEAKSGNIPDELKVKNQRIYDLLDGKVPSLNAQNEAYKELLVGACNNLNRIFPFLFERISDYTELLLPDDLTSELSIIQDIRDGMTIDDCAEVEIIGWLYQFYISAKKDEVFSSKLAVKKEDIPAATQLFTPRWIVEYMVQNTVGKLWLQNKPNSNLREHMPYFLDSPSVATGNYLKIKSVEEIKLLDQACGSGHILVYGFELFYKIYEEEGYSSSEIPELIIKNNLFGFEIDERASQLAGMAIMLKARSYNRRIFKKDTEPNVRCYQDLRISINDAKNTLKEIGVELSEDLNHDLMNMQQATNYGSLITPLSTTYELEKILLAVSEKNTSDAFFKYNLVQLSTALHQLVSLSRKYSSLVTNPPYMGSGKMNSDLSNFVRLNYPDAKSDLITCFIERGIKHLPEHGFTGLVTMESWMFLLSFENFRRKLLSNTTIHSLSHFGWHIMRIAFGTVSFILENFKPINEFSGIYSFMDYDNIDKNTDKPLTFPCKENGRFKVTNQAIFDQIPGKAIGYWLSANFILAFRSKLVFEDLGEPRQGLGTSNNTRFVRPWNEVDFNNIKFNSENALIAKESGKRWFPYIKGGGFRRWYGNYFDVINWRNNGQEIREYLKDKNPNIPRSEKHYFKEGITWGLISSFGFSCRNVSYNCIFDVGGSMAFPLNSKLTIEFLKVFSPTLNFQVGDLKQLPILIEESKKDSIEILSTKCIDISALEWNSKETSWDFKQNEIIRIKGQDVEETYDLYQHYWKSKFFQLHKNEEEINKQFIEIYGLQNDLNPDVDLEVITILKDETFINNSQLVFKEEEVFKQFMSYAVGCMFGRYSLDEVGLILANQGETLETYLSRIGKLINEVSFLPDDDNIIPLLDDEWFEDDIASRFHAFLKASFGDANFDKNLSFIEECLDKDVRKYFVKDFYADHIKRYKKRPIYWMFSSPKGSFNVLIYMHRYTPDTLNNILNNYLIEYREKLNNRIEHLDHLIVSGTSLEQTKAQKEKDRLKLVLIELLEYEREVLRPLAIERIKIDLDEGVLVNYNKFGKAIKEVAGLNDKATKKKVREFDWIDVEQIR